jgi:excisionase family DNA binding protein
MALSTKRSRSGSTAPLALRPEQAANALGVSRSFFFASVLPELRVVRRGRLRLIPVAELERWLDRNAARAFEA